MIIAAYACAILFLIGILLVLGMTMKFVIELFNDREYTFGLFIFGLWMCSVAYVVAQFVKID